MSKPPRPTAQTLKVLDALFAPRPQSGAELAKVTKLASGTLYPILMRLEQAGIVRSKWEEGDPSEMGRPRRRYYTITGEGQRYAQAAAMEMSQSLGRLIAWN